ncbi:MAG: hypothetical protein K2Q25_07375, partial [Mycobacteriaceae bacterium]|nr:hypothetical protein [Mycobacteriaceae bacterium]
AAETEDDPPLTTDLLANLQAGLLDDATAARIRKRIRADPTAATILHALNQVRSDVAALASSPAPHTPPAANARYAVHALHPRRRLARIVAAGFGLGAGIVAIGIGTAALLHPHPFPDNAATSDPPTARHITVSSTSADLALPVEQILTLLNHDPDYGPLSDPTRRAACLNGLGYPTATPLLGAQVMEIHGQRGVLLVLPGETSDKLTVIVVPITCGPLDTGLLATTVLARR